MNKKLVSLLLILALLISSVPSFAAPNDINVQAKYKRIWIVSVSNPETLTLNVGEKIEMPETVTANMSDGTTKEIGVNWYPKQLPNNRVGKKFAIGIVKGTFRIVTFTVISQEIVVPDPVDKQALYDRYIELAIWANLEDGGKLYTKEQLADLQAAADAASLVYNDINATQKEVDDALAAMNDAFDALPAPTPIIVSLVNPENIIGKVREAIDLPSTVVANMSDGTTKEVPVTWDPEKIPPNRDGELIFTGTVDEFSGTVTLKVILAHTVTLWQPDFKLDKGIKLEDAAPNGVSFTIISSDGTVIAENETKFPSDFYDMIGHGEYTLKYDGFAPGYYVYPHAVVPSKYTQTPVEGKLNEFIVEILQPKRAMVYVYLNGTIKFDPSLITDQEAALIAARKTVEEYEAKVATKEDVLELITNQILAAEVSELCTPTVNKVNV